MPTWLGPELLLAVLALGTGAVLWREARDKLVWQGAALGQLAWGLEELAWWTRRRLG
jgi:hypothetical protein